MNQQTTARAHQQHSGHQCSPSHSRSSGRARVRAREREREREEIELMLMVMQLVSREREKREGRGFARVRDLAVNGLPIIRLGFVCVCL